MDVRLRALNRFGLGARLGETSSLDDPRGWLHEQLGSAAGASTDPAAWLDRPVSMDRAAAALTRLRAAQRDRDQEALTEARRGLREVQSLEIAAVLSERLSTDTPFLERLVAFWSNHLCVSVGAKPQVGALAGHYERTAIRPHVLGRFEDMVLASARHPAMLFYLDNFQSIGPGSPAGRRTERRGNARGLNENYARELLELHTVGVEGGYDQADVEQLARMLTGWGVSGAGPGGRANEPVGFGFVFRAPVHEPGDKTVMGVRYRGSGEREGESVIRDLCRHPATADFIAGKLVRHFVADDPPPDDVARMASVFRDTEGDLTEVAGALVELDGAWDASHRKFRSPQEWLVAVLRALRVEETGPRTGQVLRQLRHSPWAPASPQGYPDTRGEWADPDSIMNRAELSRTLAGRVVAGRGTPDARRLLEVVDLEAGDPLPSLLGDRSISAEERIALAIGGPAFQWR